MTFFVCIHYIHELFHWEQNGIYWEDKRVLKDSIRIYDEISVSLTPSAIWTWVWTGEKINIFKRDIFLSNRFNSYSGQFSQTSYLDKLIAYLNLHLGWIARQDHFDLWVHSVWNLKAGFVFINFITSYKSIYSCTFKPHLITTYAIVFW